MAGGAKIKSIAPLKPLEPAKPPRVKTAMIQGARPLQPGEKTYEYSPTVRSPRFAR